MAKKKTISQMAREAGLAPTVVHQRIKTGWTLDKALSTPTRSRRPNKKPTKSEIDIQQQLQAVCVNLEAAERELILGRRRCKLIALTFSVLIALMAAVIISG
jgi:hypothetical protein